MLSLLKWLINNFISSDHFLHPIEKKVVVREYVSIGGTGGGEYSEFFVDRIHAQHIN